MDRRRALQLIAASGVGIAGSSVVASAAFADGAGSGCAAPSQRPVLVGGGNLFLNLNYGGAAGAPAQINAYTDFAFTCSGMPGSFSNIQWSWTVTGPQITAVTPSASSSWTLVPGNSIPFTVAGPVGARYVVTVQIRMRCCYGSCANWICLRRRRIGFIGTPGWSGGNDNPANGTCNSPAPICP